MFERMKGAVRALEGNDQSLQEVLQGSVKWVARTELSCCCSQECAHVTSETLR